MPSLRLAKAGGQSDRRRHHNRSHPGVGRCIGNARAPFTGETNLFIRPPYEFQVVDALLTNFHLPRSTLLVLLAAFAGRDQVLAAYHAAIDEQYRFYSYGDAMFM